jgi:hypothetical protein
MPEVVGRLRTPRLPSAPATPAVGEIYYDTVANILYWWNGTTWVSASGGAGADLSTVPLLAPTTDARNRHLGDVAARMLLSTRLSGNANDTFQLATDGSMKWGLGIANAPKVTLSYDGTDTLKISSGQLRLVGASDYGTALRLSFAADTSDRFSMDNDGTHRWGPGTGSMDTTLWYIGTRYLQLDGLMATRRTVVTDLSYAGKISGDTQNRFQVQADGKHLWGPGGSTAPDTSLYRVGAATLRTDGGVFAVGAAAANATYGTFVAGDPQYRWYITAGGAMSFGPGNVGADTNLYRVAAVASEGASIATDGSFVLPYNSGTRGYYWLDGSGAYGGIWRESATGHLHIKPQTNYNVQFDMGTGFINVVTSSYANYPFQVIVPGDTYNRFMIRGDGLLYWGPGNGGQDVYIYRPQAGFLQCSGSFSVAGNLYVSGALFIGGWRAGVGGSGGFVGSFPVYNAANSAFLGYISVSPN